MANRVFINPLILILASVLMKLAIFLNFLLMYQFSTLMQSIYLIVSFTDLIISLFLYWITIQPWYFIFDLPSLVSINFLISLAFLSYILGDATLDSVENYTLSLNVHSYILLVMIIQCYRSVPVSSLSLQYYLNCFCLIY